MNNRELIIYNPKLYKWLESKGVEIKILDKDINSDTIHNPNVRKNYGYCMADHLVKTMIKEFNDMQINGNGR